jgi:hypothetical protein
MGKRDPGADFTAAAISITKELIGKKANVRIPLNDR